VRTENITDFFDTPGNVLLLNYISHRDLVVFVKHLPQFQSIIIVTFCGNVQYSLHAKLLQFLDMFRISEFWPKV